MYKPVNVSVVRIRGHPNQIKYTYQMHTAFVITIFGNVFIKFGLASTTHTAQFSSIENIIYMRPMQHRYIFGIRICIQLNAAFLLAVLPLTKIIFHFVQLKSRNFSIIGRN